MSGIDFADTIVVRCTTEKGTRVTTRESPKSMKWTGKEFKEEQERKLKKIRGLKIQSAKGTAKIDLSKLYRTSIYRSEGQYISVRKGTELLKL